MLNITETKSTTRYNDISTVYADLVEPVVESERYTRRCDYFSCFSNHYPVGKEREFIEELDKANPGKYTGYRITWSDSN